MATPTPSDKPIVGLALAGGGFRASLFHLGVLRRLQEFNALRYVDILSTVSGGSIIGALYILHLKNAIDEKGMLEDDDYQSLLDDVERTLIEGIQKNLRNRLFLNPFGVLKLFIIGGTLSKRMASLYERYLYKDVVAGIIRRDSRRQKQDPSFHSPNTASSPLSRLFFPGRLPLRGLRYNPPVRDGIDINKGYGTYVANQWKNKATCTLPTQLILNATSLNSGAPFWFSSVEIGDPQLGFVRYADIQTIEACRTLLKTPLEKLQSILAQQDFRYHQIGRTKFYTKSLGLAIWWKQRHQPVTGIDIPEVWRDAFQAFSGNGGQDGANGRIEFPGPLIQTRFGSMRKMKLAAWFILKGAHYQPPVTGGLTEAQHMNRLWTELRRENRVLEQQLKQAVTARPALRDDLLDFVMWAYYFRSAEILSRNPAKDWQGIHMGDAVGASACFPPVFAPYELYGIYDDTHVARIGLTDGGVYDNVGIAALLDANCTHVIASDTGGLFDINQRAATGRLGMMGRITAIMMNVIGDQQRGLLRRNRTVNRDIKDAPPSTEGIKALQQEYNLQGLVYFHINSPSLKSKPPAPQDQGTADTAPQDPQPDRDLLAQIRTDLDGFGDVEANALINRGYAATDEYMRHFMKKDPQFSHLNWQAAFSPPRQIKGFSRMEVNNIIAAGRYRFFRSLKLLIPASVIATAVIVFALVAVTWGLDVSLRGVLRTAVDGVTNWIQYSMPYLGQSWADRQVPLGLLLLGAALAVIAWIKLKPMLEEKLEGTVPKIFRWYLKLAKLGRRGRRNLFWLLGYFPAVVALLLFLVSAVSYVFYYLPFKLYTKVHQTGED